MIPVGLCQCGCGQQTRRSNRSAPSYGYKRGDFLRFIQGHGMRGTARHYPERVVEGVKHSVRVHRLMAEQALGHPLPKGACVHHVDEDVASVTPRLVICQNNSYHRLLHYRGDVLAAGGNPNTDRLCIRCRIPQPVSNFYRRGNGYTLSHCKDCIAYFNAQRKFRP